MDELPLMVDSPLVMTETPGRIIAPIYQRRPYSASTGTPLKKRYKPRRPGSSSGRRVPSAFGTETERVYADRSRVLRQLQRFGGTDEDHLPPSDEIELAKTTASVVSKIRCFYY